MFRYFLAGNFLAHTVTFRDFMAGNFLAGDFLAGNFLAHHATYSDFMAGNFLDGDFLGWIRYGYVNCLYLFCYVASFCNLS